MRFIVALLTFVFAAACLASGKPMHFERLTIKDGLSQNSVFYSLRDSRGFMWLGTLDGLNRYDGYEFKAYKHDPNRPGTIAGNVIYAIVEDKNGDLWIGTDNGLSRYDRDFESFEVYRHDPTDDSSIGHNMVRALAFDEQGRLWAATGGGGLNRFEDGRFIRFNFAADDPNSISHDYVKAIHFDRFGKMWVGTEQGLNRYNSQSNSFSRYYHEPGRAGSLSSSDINAILEDSKGRMWLGTENGGLNRWGMERSTFTHYRHSKDDNSSLSHNSVKALFEDGNGTIWVGTDAGINLLNPQTHQIKHFRHRNGDPFSIGSDFVMNIYDDSHGTIWVGTAGGAVNRYQLHRARFGHFNHQPGNPDSLSHNMVQNIHVDSKNTLWVATRGGGLNYYDEASGSFRQYRYDKDDLNSLSDDYVTFVYEDSAQNLWVGTGTGGLNRFDSKTKTFKHYRASPGVEGALQSDHIRYIYQDKRGTLWVSTSKGLSRYNKEKDNFFTYRHNPNDPSSISHDWSKFLYEDDEGNFWVTTLQGFNRFDRDSGTFERFMPDTDDPERLSHGNVNFILRDSRGLYWVGTYGGGLHQFNAKTGKFSRYRSEQGLPNDVIYGGLEDNQGELWFSTNMGLFKYNSQSKTFKNYDANDGAQGNEFNRNAFFKARDGELFFGGLNGFNRFYPSKIINNPTPPQLAITDLLLFNQSVKVGEPIGGEYFSLPQTISSTDKIILDHTQSLVTFEFAAFDYINPGKVRYAYSMQGLDKQWIYTDAKNRRATYTHLGAGKYKLKVKASNADGVWNEQGVTIDIRVMPPPWGTWWAYSLYVLIAVALIYIFVSMRLAQNKARDQLVLNRELRHINKLKDAFLANTSHELRTPLNGIIGLAESMIDGAAGPMSQKARKNLAMVVASGRRLSDLINDILDFSKLKHEQVVLKPKALDLHTLTEIVLTLLMPLTKDKPLKLSNDVPETLGAVHADENRLLQILHNLVGNAIKFTDAGEVKVGAYVDNDSIVVTIQDTGIGIAPHHFDSIFDDFSQLEADNNRSHGGTGLGLSITRQLVRLHGGDIWLNSELGQGSLFSFSLPVARQKAQNTMSIAPDVLVNDRDNEDFEGQEIETSVALADGFDGARFKLLIVDDEPINLQVLSNHLQLAKYQVEQAHDGVEALQMLCIKGPFDLVLLDIMMPKMSGYEVCKRIREQWSVSDLPVIFLTAKNQIEDMVQGFAVGANDHLTKPISKHELLLRVKTHLQLLDINRSLEIQVNERTEQMVEAQKKADLSEKLAQLGGLMAGVAHEINNPTNFVHVSVQSLEHDLAKCQQFIFDLAADADEEVLDSFRLQFAPLHEHISTIKDGTYRIKNIVRDLKTSTHFSDDEKKVVCITDMLSSTINLVSTNYKEFARIESRFECHPEITCYPAKLNQVFVNLLVNAFDAIKQKQRQEQYKIEGHIVVACRKIDNDGGASLEISVRDNGIGIDEQTQARLFEAYFTTKAVGEGTGLGLSISSEIVQNHGGRLSVQSVVGEGSEFILHLPL